MLNQQRQRLEGTWSYHLVLSLASENTDGSRVQSSINGYVGSRLGLQFPFDEPNWRFLEGKIAFTEKKLNNFIIDVFGDYINSP